MIERLCEKLNMKPDEVYEMNYLDALNWLSMWAMKDKHIEDLHKQQMQKYKMK